MYRDGMWAMFRKEGSDHAGLTRMIEALFGLVSSLSMLVESMERSAEVYRDGMWAMLRKKEGFDHAGLTRMIEAFSGLVSCLPMLVESMRGGEFFTSRKERLKEGDDI